MIAEDSAEQNAQYRKFLTNDKNIEVVAQTYDGEQTLLKYFEYKPDLLILDLDLPKMNGLEVIDRISEFPDEKKKCNILIVSGKDTFRHKLYNTAKVYMNLQKPVDYDRIIELIKDFDKERLSSSELNENDIKRLLVSFNISPYSKNSSILISATIKAFRNQYLLRNTKLLYQEVGKEINMNYKQVQWSIRNSINTINHNISDVAYNKYFGSREYDYLITPTTYFVKVIQYYEERHKV